jgi:enamine deaminase RidA (YjgF/YER057c/UK114 family)
MTTGGAEQRLKELGIDLPAPPAPFGIYAEDVFGKQKNPSRLVYGVASLPLGAPVELEVIFEVAG